MDVELPRRRPLDTTQLREVLAAAETPDANLLRRVLDGLEALNRDSTA